MDDYNDFLFTTVLQENRPVTYKSMARSLKIHVDTAKQALYTFANENSSKVHAVYCITGQMIKTKQFTIQLVKSTELEDTKRQFKTISGVHVYSITSYEPIDFSVLYAACKDTPKLSLEERYACGALKTPNATYRKLEKSRAVQNKPAAPAFKPSVAPASKPAPSLIKPPRKGTLSFASAKKTDTKETPAKAPTKTPAKAPAKDSKKGVVTGVKRKTNHDEDIEEKMAKASIKVQDIFSDDEEEEQEEKKNMPEAEDAMEIDDIIDEAEDKKDIIEIPDSPKENAVERAVTPPPPGKAKRKVLKKKTTMNARGHMVTEEVWEWEEIDESELPASKPAPKPAPSKAAPTTSKNISKKTAATKKGPAQQTNLFSFFNKK